MKVKLMLVSLFMFALLFSENLSAGSFLSVRGFSGYSMPTGRIRSFYIDERPVLGGGADYLISPQIGFTFGFYFTHWIGTGNTNPYPAHSSSAFPDQKIKPFTAGLLINPFVGSQSHGHPIDFYLVLGGGLYLVEKGATDRSKSQVYVLGETQKRGGFAGGGRFMVNINSRAGVYLEAKYNYITGPSRFGYVDELIGFAFFIGRN
ncbi:MAG: hypothetical protein P8184_21065 [Calditrichia bacterium]